MAVNRRPKLAGTCGGCGTTAGGIRRPQAQNHHRQKKNERWRLSTNQRANQAQCSDLLQDTPYAASTASPASPGAVTGAAWRRTIDGLVDGLARGPSSMQSVLCIKGQRRHIVPHPLDPGNWKKLVLISTSTLPQARPATTCDAPTMPPVSEYPSQQMPMEVPVAGNGTKVVTQQPVSTEPHTTSRAPQIPPLTKIVRDPNPRRTPNPSSACAEGE